MYNSDSLQMTSLYGKIRSEYNINLTDIYEYNSISKLAKKIQSSKMDVYKTKEKILEIYRNGIMEQGDYYQESQQKYTKRVKEQKNIDINIGKDYNNILVTGATGYLSIYIVRELLENTESRLSIIIRKLHNISVEERFKNKVERYFEIEFWEKYKDRIDIYEGDMLASNFGIGNNE